MRRVIIIVLAISFTFFSCKQSDETILTEISNYIPMKIGDYWIYQHVKIDTIGDEELLAWTDSIYIARDTSIDENKYFVFEKKRSNSDNSLIYRILRDSSGCLINNEKHIVFSSSNFKDTLSNYSNIISDDTLFTQIIYMAYCNHEINVPAGNFQVLNAVAKIYSDKIPPQIDNPRILNNYYADGIGQIIDSYVYLSSPDIFEKRLIRYHIKD